MKFLATAPQGMADLLANELQTLGAGSCQIGRSGVVFSGALPMAYRACYHSRIANRVLFPLASWPAPDGDTLYAGARAIPWHEHLSPDTTFAIDVSGRHDSSSGAITHQHYAALRLKDAIVDFCRDRHGRRPSVDPDRPGLRLHLNLHGHTAHVYIDIGGTSLHRRGYRREGARAPLKENLAAAILLRSGWQAGMTVPLVDPMCGSGTLLIEAALMAANIPPGLVRSAPAGCRGWLQHDVGAWRALRDEAAAQRAGGMAALPPLWGYDSDPRATQTTLANAKRAGLEGAIHVECRDISAATPPPDAADAGHVVVNPPYGERLGSKTELFALYARLGAVLQERFAGWQAHMFIADSELGHNTGLRAHKKHTLHNGALACTLLHFDLSAAPETENHHPGRTALANRLRKNCKQLTPWARQAGIHCYRVYDADLPEYAVAIDLYEQYAHIQEYQAPRHIDASRAKARLRDVLAVVPEVLQIPPQHVYLKTRQRQRGTAQYSKQDSRGDFVTVREGDCQFYVNFTDYLDTGLFLDHRPLRTLLNRQAAGKRFLNLFAYTGTATVAAARGGASMSTTVDISKTYLQWAEDNFRLNDLNVRHHELVRADCLEWLADCGETYDVIMLDPPTFSNSKRMTHTLDVQRDHVRLITLATQLLSRRGVLYFSTNAQSFKLAPLDEAALNGRTLVDITASTIPRDFAGGRPIHRCWRIAAKR